MSVTFVAGRQHALRVPDSDLSADRPVLIAFDREPPAFEGLRIGWRTALPGSQPIDPARCDLLISAWPEPGAWRCLALPVADSVYADEIDPDVFPRPLHIGPVGATREKTAWTMFEGQRGVLAEDPDPQLLRRLLRQASIGVATHAQGAPGPDDRAALHLAAGHLLLSDRLQPSHGLAPGFDHIEADNAFEFEIGIWRAQGFPQAWTEIRRRGRFAAELFRASRVYPRVIEDALRHSAALPPIGA